MLTGQPPKTLLCSTAIAFQPVPAALVLMRQRRKSIFRQGKATVCLAKHASVEKSFLQGSAVGFDLCCDTEPLDEDSGNKLGPLLGEDL